jgi:hypothetical protein
MMEEVEIKKPKEDDKVQHIDIYADIGKYQPSFTRKVESNASDNSMTTKQILSSSIMDKCKKLFS